MKIEDKKFKSVNQKNHIHVKIWHPDCEALGKENVKGVIQIAHGMIDHIERYEDMAKYFAGKGFVVAGNDHLGHGDSVLRKEDYGYFTEGNASLCVVEDMYKLTRIMKNRYPNLPYILIGHSMGSFLSRRYLSDYGHELDGAVLLGTGNQPYPVVRAGIALAKIVKVFKGERYRSKFLNQVMFGTYNSRIPNALTSKDWVCGDGNVVRGYMEDEKCDYIFTVNGYLGLLTTIDYVKRWSNIKKIPKNLPVFLAAGTEDPVGGYGKDVKKLFEIYSRHLNDVELRLYEGCRHELHNESIKQDVFDDIYRWIVDRMETE